MLTKKINLCKTKTKKQTNSNQSQKTNQQIKKIIWFNPSFNEEVSSNQGWGATVEEH